MTTTNAANGNVASTSNKGTVMKDKVVIFALSSVMRMPDMVKKGYQRAEVTELFIQLQKDGLGLYTPGTRGKGNCAVFEFWGEMPESYTMTFKVEKLHTDYAGKPGTPLVTTAVVAKDAAVAGASLLPQFAGEKTAPLGGFRYSIEVDGDVLRLCRDGGEESIEDALRAVWDEIGARVEETDSVHMNRVEKVASKLRGLGFYELSVYEPEAAAAGNEPVRESDDDEVLDMGWVG